MLCVDKILPAPKWTSLKAGKKSFTAKWKKVSGASFYQVTYITGNKAKTKITAKTSLKVSKLKKGKKYQVYVTAVKEDDIPGTSGAIQFPGDASKVKTVKVK